MVNKEQSELNIEHRITKIETCMAVLRDDVKLIKENHLVHLEARLDNIEKKLGYYAGGLAVITVAVQLLILYFK